MMEPVLTPAQMRRADEATIAGGVPGAELMDRAAHACAVVALRMLGGGYGRRVVAVCGKGNNGGDGLACARHLWRAGVRATVFTLGPPEGDAAVHLQRARTVAPHMRVLPWSAGAFEREVVRADLVVDAVFGTGLSAAPRGPAAEAVEAIERSGARVVAVDMPSGVSGADGSIPGPAVRADVTLAIQALKVGHVVAPGAFRCGRLDVADIGIGPVEAEVFVPDAADVAGVLPPIEPDTHKYRRGALGILAGSAGMTGAATLAARGALRSGAGLVVLGVPASTLDVFEATVIEAVKVPLPASEGQLEAKAVDEFGDRLKRCRALAVGPGLGRGPRGVALVRRALDVPLPLVVDGDGLWALGEILRDEPRVLLGRGAPAVLTPHTGEFAYLAGEPPGPDRVRAARELAGRLGAVVHLKGRRALTASAEGTVWVNVTGNPGQATGGTGDVLTGVVASLIAQGAPAADATWAGAYLHGLAGDVVAARRGRRSLAAGDLPTALPEALGRVSRHVRVAGRIRTVVEAAR
jgi:NAD(P)H-hydrate epimerase